LRRTLAVRRARRRRRRIAAIAACAAVALALPAVLASPTLLVWNASASVPTGLYRVMPGRTVQRGAMVVAWPPAPARRLAAQRGYLPATVPLVKRAAAVNGDRVCAAGEEIRVNGRLAARRRRIDSAGRPMPWWRGCRLLGRGDSFLLGDRPDSFDGRYFGMTSRATAVGPAVLVWPR
jgi:conjugative transfer signal peptidase TraF